MSTYKTLLEEVLDYWYEVRRGLIKEVNNIPASRFNFRATLETRSITELLQHVLEVSILTVEELLREDTNLHRAPYAELLHFYAPNISRADTQETLVNLMVEQFKDADQRLRKAGDLHMMQLITKQDGSTGTRLAILKDTIGHERYHRGQLTVYERLLGLEPVSTKEMQNPMFSNASPRNSFSQNP
jgi:uncharacterized damage-inducible protein DinB